MIPRRIPRLVGGARGGIVRRVGIHVWRHLGWCEPDGLTTDYLCWSKISSVLVNDLENHTIEVEERILRFLQLA